VIAVHEHKHPVAVTPRDDEDLMQVLTGELAVEREVDEPCASGRVVALGVPAADDRHNDHG
jgi:hypothetical protein